MRHGGCWWILGMAAAGSGVPAALRAQQADTLDTHTLPPITVSVTRADLPLAKTALAVQSVSGADISRGRPTWGLDEALATVPGVYVANRYNFSLDQRISIRGFGSRSAFAVRGVKVLLDGIPQTLPDGQGQLTNLELGAVDRIEVLRGSSSALFGNASGGVISIWTDPTLAGRFDQEVRVVAGSFDPDLERAWTKVQSVSRLRLGAGSAMVTASRLDYEGERDHTNADLRVLNTRLHLPLGARWSLGAVALLGDDPRADNPGALTLAELRVNRDSAARLNLLRDAGKDVRQLQGGVTLRGHLAGDGDAQLIVFGLTRELTNPLPQAYIMLDRGASGVRASASRGASVAGRPLRLTGGIDLQWQKDDRREYGYVVPNAALTTPDNRPDTLTRAQREHVAELGPFVQALLELTPRLSVSGGLRYDRVRFRVDDRHLTDGADNSGRRVMEALSLSLGIAFSPGPAWTAYANVGSAFETPTTTELSNQPPPGGGGFNPDLDPQRAWSYEVGARGGGAAGGRASWSVAVYQASVRDELIAFEDPTVPGRRFFRNAASARHRGVEVGGSVAVAAGLEVGATWTYSDFRYTDYRLGTYDLAGKAIPGIPAHWLRLGLKARPAFAAGTWVELETMHSAGHFVNDTLDVRATPWTATNVRAGWEGAVGALRLAPFVGINNVFDKRYVGSVVINAALGRYYEPAPGRNAYVGVSVGVQR